MPKLAAPLWGKEIFTAWGGHARDRGQDILLVTTKRSEADAGESEKNNVGGGHWIHPHPATAPRIWPGNWETNTGLAATSKLEFSLIINQLTHTSKAQQTCACRHDLFAKGSNHLGN